MQGSFRILRPVLQTTLDPYYAVQDPVWVEFETLNTDDDAMLFDTVSTSADHYYNISDCVSFGHFNYHLDLTVAGKFTEGTQALTEPFFITILLEPCFQAGAGTDFEWSLTMNSSTPLTAQVSVFSIRAAIEAVLM